MNLLNLNIISRALTSLVGMARRAVRSPNVLNREFGKYGLTPATAGRLFRRNSPTLLILCALSATLHADDFQTGLDAYHESQYAQAAAAFEQALTHEESAAARHNLALSLYQQGKPAEAAWQLERATRLAPLNESYLYKLGALRQQLGLYQQPVEWWQIASRFLAPSTWTWIASLSIWFVLAAWLLPRIGKFRRPIALKLLTAAALLSLILSGAALTILQTQQASGIVVVNEASTLRYAPASAAPEAGLARPGERARVLDQHNEFLKIETEAKITGWIEQGQFREL